jgi:exonuclease SbcC
MLEGVRIIGFQSHEDTEIEFHPGVNAIKGTSNAGKSVIIRAMRWCLQNRPRGTGFVRRGEDFVSVAAQFTEGGICRERYKTRNGFRLLDEDGEEQWLDAVNVDMPSEATAISQMNEINIKGQFDGFYLLQETSGSVAKKISNAVGLQIIEKAVKYMRSKTAEYKRQKGLIRKGLEECEGHINRLSNVPKLVKLCKDMDRLIIEKAEIINNITEIEDALVVINDSEAAKEELVSFLTIENDIEAFDTHLKNYTDLAQSINDLEQTTTILKHNEEEKQGIVGFLSVEDKVNKLVELLKKRNEKRIIEGKISDVCSHIHQLEILKNRAAQKLKNKEEALSATLDSLEFCPLCERPMNESVNNR